MGVRLNAMYQKLIKALTNKIKEHVKIEIRQLSSCKESS